MLKIGRRPEESITIFKPDKQKLGVVIYCKKHLLFDFPRDFQIVRTELLEQPRAMKAKQHDQR